MEVASITTQMFLKAQKIYKISALNFLLTDLVESHTEQGSSNHAE